MGDIGTFVLGGSTMGPKESFFGRELAMGIIFSELSAGGV